MEYVRKHRWANYGSPKCKEYLRNDFSHECAYCKLQEREVGFIAMDYFEIDHFKPQSSQLPGVHEYDNLFYSCQKCNNFKSNKWENLLNPCVDDVFSGDTPAIVGGNHVNQYKYIPQNEKGAFYIELFKLNSRKHISIRKARSISQNKMSQINSLIDEILTKFKKRPELEHLNDLILQLDSLRDLKTIELESLPKDENFENTKCFLDSCGIKNSIVLEEYNMDFKIKINNDTYYCELVVDDSYDIGKELRKNISVEKLRTWFEKIEQKFGILFYYPNASRLYFYPICDNVSISEISSTAVRKQIILNDTFLITKAG